MPRATGRCRPDCSTPGVPEKASPNPTRRLPAGTLAAMLRAHPRRMKNVNIYVDVDLTLVDETGRLLPGAADGLRRLKARGCHLFLWSTGGADYCRETATVYGLADVFEAFRPSRTLSSTTRLKCASAPSSSTSTRKNRGRRWQRRS